MLPATSGLELQRAEYQIVENTLARTIDSRLLDSYLQSTTDERHPERLSAVFGHAAIVYWRRGR